METYISHILVDRGFSDLNPLLCGEEKCAPHHSFGPCVRDYYLLHYVLSGRGHLSAPTGEYDLSAGQFFLIRPDEINTYRAEPSDPWHYLWIGFSGRLATRFDALPSPVGTLLPDIFLEFQTAMHRGFPGWETMREEYLVTILHRIMAELLARPQPQGRYARRAENVIRTMYMQELSVEQIAAMLSVDRRYLSRLFRARYGITMQEFLIRTRLAAGATLLRQGRSVSESAALCGYRDPLNFSKMFRRRYGCSPLAYAAGSPAPDGEGEKEERPSPAARAE